MRIIVAVDPGASGGIAYSCGSQTVVEKMPDTPLELWKFVASLKALGGERDNTLVVYMEKVTGFVAPPKHLKPGDKVYVTPSYASFNYGKGVGRLEMAFLAVGAHLEEVSPQVWQKPLFLGVKGNRSTTVWKNLLKDKAQQYFPQLKVTLATADALLLLSYALLRETGSFQL